MRRYWFATLTAMFMSYGMLMALIYGFVSNREAITDEITGRFGDPVAAINWALGFIIGMFAFSIVGMFTQGLQGMARTGELEQLCLSPHGLATNFLGRSLVTAVTSILSSSVMLLMVAYSVEGVIYFEPGKTILLLVLTFVNLIGFGFLVGGLVLVFKQVGQVAMLLRLGLFGLGIGASESINTWPTVVRWIGHSMPITDAAICLKYVLIKGQMRPVRDELGAVVMKPVSDEMGTSVMNGAELLMEPMMEYVSLFQHPSLYALVMSCVLWTTLGIFFFKYFENWSRDRGTLGAY